MQVKCRCLCVKKMEITRDDAGNIAGLEVLRIELRSAFEKILACPDFDMHDGR